MMPFGIFGILFVPMVLTAPADASTTAQNILSSEGLFRLSIVSMWLSQTIFVFLALSLYKLLRPVSNDAAATMLILALAGVPIAFFNELNHVAVLHLLHGGGYLGAFTAEHLRAQAMLLLDLRTGGIAIAQIFWGLWLMPLGYLVYRSGFLPWPLGLLLALGGCGYVFDSCAHIVFPQVSVTISQFTFIGEVVLPLWLLFKGVNLVQWERFAGAPPNSSSEGLSQART
jgi:hypothetical protein